MPTPRRPSIPGSGIRVVSSSVVRRNRAHRNTSRSLTAKLAADKNYKGETWKIDAKQLSDGAEVRIEVLPVEGKDNRRRLRVEAAYPAGEPVARRTREITVEVK